MIATTHPLKSQERELKSEQSFDVAQRDKLYIRLRVTDSAGEFHEEPMIVQVTTVNDAPTGIALEVDTIAENSPEDTLVSAIVVTDPDEFSIAGVGEGLLAHYKFDGDITDSSGNGHDASFVSMNSADSFVDGQVLQFVSHPAMDTLTYQLAHIRQRDKISSAWHFGQNGEVQQVPVKLRCWSPMVRINNAF